MLQIYGFEKFSLVDYDGYITCCIFTGGCNFACPFCHNKSLVYLQEKPNIDLYNEVLDYLNKRKGLVDAVCISGGEPTLQKDLKDFNVRTAPQSYVYITNKGVDPNERK